MGTPGEGGDGDTRPGWGGTPRRHRCRDPPGAAEAPGRPGPRSPGSPQDNAPGTRGGGERPYDVSMSYANEAYVTSAEPIGTETNLES